MSETEMALIRIFKEAINSVLPHNRIKSLLKIHENQLKLQNQIYEIPKNGVTIVGFGKAVIGMAAELHNSSSSWKVLILLRTYVVCSVPRFM